MRQFLISERKFKLNQVGKPVMRQKEKEISSHILTITATVEQLKITTPKF